MTKIYYFFCQSWGSEWRDFKQALNKRNNEQQQRQEKPNKQIIKFIYGK